MFAATMIFAMGACTADSPQLAGTAEAIANTGQRPHKKLARTIAHMPGTPDLKAAPPGKDFCLGFGSVCFSALELRKAYGVSSLVEQGFDGTGETIVLIESFGSPTIADDLDLFDQVYDIPPPPSLQVIAPLGIVPFDPNDGEQVGWAYETTLDVEVAHAMAPGAGIVVLTSPVDETEGLQGMPEFLALETYALDHHLGKIISQSWGATENTLFDAPGRAVIAQFERFFARARREHVTALAASGDTGSTNYMLDFETLYPDPVVGYPASSPNVTAVGGTAINTDDDGNWASEIAWGTQDFGGSGGGVSQMFGEPLYQRLLPRTTQRLLGGRRGIPDLAANASGDSGVIIIITDPVFGQGLGVEAGTSEASPLWAGIVADLNQLAGRPLGFLNGKLYLLGALGLLRGEFHDITVGNNSYNVGDPENPIIVPGYDATPGWDLVTGWGTPSLERLGQLLASLPYE